MLGLNYELIKTNKSWLTFSLFFIFVSPAPVFLCARFPFHFDKKECSSQNQVVLKGTQSDQIQLSIFYRTDLVESMSFDKVGKLQIDFWNYLQLCTKSMEYFNFHPISLETCVCSYDVANETQSHSSISPVIWIQKTGYLLVSIDPLLYQLYLAKEYDALLNF